MGMLRGVPRWYTFGMVKGKMMALGPAKSEGSARSAANNINDWDTEPEIKMYRTIQLSVAKACFKYEKSQQTGSLGMSVMPIRSVSNKKTTRFEQIKENRGIE